ncbi:MAG: thioredoxin domain-containing protein [Acidobacteria bacterium]|nr:thioredoxin domain-containing protein [Acidobacteriota bacterium]MBV9623303.1 thioredoxin domain-containing protein [Acidobacteriota bacterium]
MNEKLLHALSLVFLFSCFSLLCSAQDPALLRPPKGAQVALVVFEDLQCPKCRSDSPLEEQAAREHSIPLVRHDFPLPNHNWSFNAAVLARYFESQSKQLGDQFRDYIFQHQPEITPDNLQNFAQKFAADHKANLPFVVDPQGKFAALVTADKELGRKVGIQHTPTIYVVSSRNPARPFVEVTDSKQLFQLVESVQHE